jgi:Mg2+ and Co2+ transporter CorA
LDNKLSCFLFLIFVNYFKEEKKEAAMSQTEPVAVFINKPGLLFIRKHKKEELERRVAYELGTKVFE